LRDPRFGVGYRLNSATEKLVSISAVLSRRKGKQKFASKNYGPGGTMNAAMDLTQLLGDLKSYCEQQAVIAEEHADQIDKVILDEAKSEQQSRNQDRIKSLREIARMFRTIIEDV
jgi:hypothetical protein